MFRTNTCTSAGHLVDERLGHRTPMQEVSVSDPHSAIGWVPKSAVQTIGLLPEQIIGTSRDLREGWTKGSLREDIR